MTYYLDIARKIAALEIILTAPLWPKREHLPDAGQALFDMIVADAKSYAGAISDNDFTAALVILNKWAGAFNAFIDTTLIAGNEPCERMVLVFRHYADSFGADFNAIKR
jgi:hypothetical protein